MGKVIAKKIRGMNLWTKVALVTLCTMLISVFMYEGWYKPKDAPAATVTYYMGIDTTTSLVADGTCNVTGLTPYTVTGIGKTTTRTTEAGTGYRVYPNTTASTSVTALNVYTPTYATDVDISAISASAALRGIAATDTVKLDLYEYDPAGAANNGTLVASSAAKTLTGGTTTTQYTWTAANFTINGTGRVAAGHRLQFRFTWYSLTTASTARVYFGLAGATTSTNFTVTETAAAAAPTITTVSPNTRAQGSAAASVTITGTNLTGGTVSFSNTGVTGGTPTVANATTITLPVTVTAGATTGAGTVTVTTAGGSVNSAFTVTAAPNPTVTTTSPNNMNQGAGPTTVAINGTNFLNGATVAFSGTGITLGAVTYVNSTQLTVPVTVAAGATTGARNVTVTLPGSQAGTGTGVFTVNAASSPPTITTVSPNSLAQGATATSVTITGTNLTGGTVSFSNTGVTGGTPTVANATTITLPVTVAAGATTGAGTVTVTTAGGSANSAFTVNAAAVNGTTASALTYSGLTSSSITVTAPFTGDSNTNNSCVIKWGTVIGTYPNTATATKSGNSYVATINSLTASTIYYFQATFSDVDGVTGSPVAGSQTTSAAGNLATPHMHNATNLGSTYRGGTWGNDKDCSWCHNASTTNVKRIATPIQTLEGPKTVIFTRMTSASHSVPGVFGDDERTYAIQASTNVCEVCHHSTTYHQYSGSKVGRPVQHVAHPNNNKDCTGCHAHSTGFKADCSSCHGFPPVVVTLGGPSGLASPATLALGASPGNAGAHTAHGTLGMLCATCHNNYNIGVSHPSSSIQIDFAMNGINWPGKFAGTATFGTFSGNAPTGGSPAVQSSGGTTIVRTTANNTNNSCNVYCHGNWAGANGNTNPRWAGGPTQANCGTCHGASNSQPPQTGTHTTHAATTLGNYAFSCSKCHPKVTSGADGHVDGSVQWRLSTGSNLIGSTAAYRTGASGSTGTVALGSAFGNCTNIYCHSDVQAANGNGVPTSFKSVQWGTAALGCAGCHADMSSATGTGDHAKHANTYGYSCRQCHGRGYSFNTISTATHVNRNINLNFSLGTIAPATTYSKTNSFLAGSAVYGNCSNSYCHSNAQGQGGTGAKTYRQPVWGTTTTNCGSCHQNMATFVNISSGDHKMHAQTYAYSCAICHGASYTSTTVPTGANTTHVNGQVNLAFTGNAAGTAYNKGTAYAPGTAYTTCQTSYCHSNAQGQGGTGTITYRKPTWGTTTTNCGSCHQNMATFVNLSSGSHKAHAQQVAAYTCDVCHGSTYGVATVPKGASSTHANKLINLTFTGNAAGTTYGKGTAGFAPGTAYTTCSTSKCHGQGAPTWGALYTNGTVFPYSTNTCDTCHATMTAVASGGAFYSTAAPTKVTAPTDAQVGAHFNHLSSNSTRIGVSAHCNDCHLVPATVKSAGHMDGSPVVTFGSRAGVQSTYSSATSSCSTYCHGATLSSNKIATGSTLAALVPHPRWNNDTLLTATVKTAPTPADCGKCHGFPPQSSGHSSYATKPLTATAGSNCNGCHKHLNANATFNDISLHIDGTVQGGSCLGCHSAYAKDTASTKARDAAASYFNANSHHIQGRAVTNADCYICHMEADATGNPTTQHEMKQAGTVDLVVWSAGVRSATYIKYTSSGTRAQLNKLNQHCLGCHTGGTFGTEPANPFGDGKKPSQYAWDARSIAEKYSQTGTTTWSQYSTANTNKKKHLKKAYSSHGNAANNQMGWNTTNGVDGDITDITSNVNVVCFDCHNSHGSNVSGKTVSYNTMSSAKYNGGIFKDISSSIGGYSATYKPKAGGNTGSKNAYNPGASLCFDCHNNRSAAANKTPWGYGTTAQGGTFGATAPLYGYWDTPYFGNYTFASVKRNTYKAGASNAMTANKGGHYGSSSTLGHTPTQQISGICTPCHDPHGVSPNTTATGINGAQQYAVPLLKGTWVTSPYKEDMAPANATRPRGGGSKQTVMNYGSDVLYNIDQNTFRKNRASITQINAGASIAFNLLSTSASRLQTVADTDFAGLCIKCHAKTNLTDAVQASTATWKTKNRIHQTVEGWAATSGTGGNVNNKVHAYTCSKCHAPHNSRLPRLMVTNCLDMKHRGKATSGGSVSSAAAGGTTAADTGNLQSTVNSTGKGAGRFPSGGARYTGTKSITSGAGARNPGPWMFGVAQGGTAASSYTTNCHNTATSGGTTYTPANQQWNTKTIW